MQLVVNRGKLKGKLIPVTGSRFLIGRDPECQLRPLSGEVSPRHAELRITSSIVVIRDLGSASGTRVNGRTVTGPASLRSGDQIEIGPLSFTALVDERNQSNRSAMEDEVASWLTDSDREDEEEWVHRTAGCARETTRGAPPHGRGGSSRTAQARRGSRGAKEGPGSS
jgi:pSer/pThr/pTyr-binding forkhead associated (FHA) protein